MAIGGGAIFLFPGASRTDDQCRQVRGLFNDNGIIDIKWRVGRTDGADCLVASWREIGGPPVQEPEKTGFGSRLVTLSLRAFGEVTLAYEPFGVTMPLSKLQRANGDSA